MSQDGSEIYLTVAKFGSAYLSYLDNRTLAGRGWNQMMVLQSFGPWLLHERDDVEHFSEIIVAFVMSCKSAN